MDPRIDRRNGWCYLWPTLLFYVAAPVFYVGVVQAALFDKLGTSATLANLPSVGYFLASFAPVLVACGVRARHERAVAVLTNALMAVLVALVALVLFLPFGRDIRIAAIILQGFFLGVLASINQVYLMQCLGRGTSERGRSWALKMTYTFGPMAAVLGSLAAQYIIGGHLRFLQFPKDFAVLYMIAVPCSAVGAWFSWRFELPEVKEVPVPPFWASLGGSFRRYVKSAALRRLFWAYVFWYAAFLALSNLSLYTRYALGAEPAAYSGIITAVQFGSKAVAGFAFGILYLRRGIRAPLIATVTCLGLAMIWAWAVPGYAFFGAFALIGAGQLGGVYFPNVLLTWSDPADATQNMAVLGLAPLLASPAPALYGFLADHFGFSSSFVLGLVLAVMGLLLALTLPLVLKGSAGSEPNGRSERAV